MALIRASAFCNSHPSRLFYMPRHCWPSRLATSNFAFQLNRRWNCRWLRRAPAANSIWLGLHCPLRRQTARSLQRLTLSNEETEPRTSAQSGSRSPTRRLYSRRDRPDLTLSNMTEAHRARRESAFTLFPLAFARAHFWPDVRKMLEKIHRGKALHPSRWHPRTDEAAG